jgi:hypothetical protein
MLTLEQVKLAMSEEHEYKGWKGEPCTSDGQDILTDEYSFEYEGHKFSHEEQFGGEGQGDDYWIVFSVASLTDDKDVTYYKVPGWHQSHCGSELEWDNLFEVKSVEKTVTVWEESK